MKRAAFLVTLMYSSATVFGMQGDKRVSFDQRAASFAKVNISQVSDGLSNRLSKQLLEKRLFESEQRRKSAEKDCETYFALYEDAEKRKQDAVEYVFSDKSAKKDCEIYFALYEDAKKQKQDDDERIKTLTQLLAELDKVDNSISDKEIMKKSLGLKTSLDLKKHVITISSKDGEELRLEFGQGYVLVMSESLFGGDRYICDTGKDEWTKTINDNLNSLSERDLHKMKEQASRDKEEAEDEVKRLKQEQREYVDQIEVKYKELKLKLGLDDRLNYFVKCVSEKEDLFVTCIKLREAKKSLYIANIRYNILNEKLAKRGLSDQSNDSCSKARLVKVGSQGSNSATEVDTRSPIKKLLDLVKGFNSATEVDTRSPTKKLLDLVNSEATPYNLSDILFSYHVYTDKTFNCHVELSKESGEIKIFDLNLRCSKEQARDKIAEHVYNILMREVTEGKALSTEAN